MPGDFGEELVRINSHSLGNIEKFNHVQPPLSAFEFGHKGLRAGKALRKVHLSHTGLPAGFGEEVPKIVVPGCKYRFRHASPIRTSQNQPLSNPYRDNPKTGLASSPAGLRWTVSGDAVYTHWQAGRAPEMHLNRRQKMVVCPTVVQSDSLKRMALDLETLKTEMQDFLKDAGLAVFYGHPRTGELAVYWDTERHGDFREFVAVAAKAGAKLIVFSEQQFSGGRIENARFQMEECDLTRDEARNFESRLHQFEAYEDFTCAVELSFHLEGRSYIFELKTDWCRAFNQLLGEIDAYLPEPEDFSEEEDEGPIGGYFSKN